MVPGKHNFTIYQGSKLVKVFEWSEGTAPAVPVDLTGYTARMQTRSSVAAVSVILDYSTTEGHIDIDGPAGRVTITIPATETALLEEGTMVYDLELLPGGIEADAFRFVQGEITVDPEVTR